MAAARDPVAEIIAACKVLRGEEHRVRHEGLGRDLTVEALRRKLDALASGSFPFLRGTFHLMAADLLQGRVPGAGPAAPEGLIGGDVHLENFGTYRGASGALCFDVNDFDEVGWGPLDLDLRRLCTSAMLLPGIGREPRLAAARELAQAWAEAVERLGGRFPIPSWGLDKAEGWLQQLLREKGRRTEMDLVAKAAPEKGHRRFAEDGDPPKFAHAADPWPRMVELALGEYYDHLNQLKADTPGKGWKLLDVAYRFKGTGSLGRLRFAALLGDGEERMLLEFKEAAPSTLQLARGRNTSSLSGRACRPRPSAGCRAIHGRGWPAPT